jgi:hypothetical protein
MTMNTLAPPESDTKARAERVDAYLETLARIEPDIAMIDVDAAAASVAISLRRIADSLEKLVSIEKDRNKR